VFVFSYVFSFVISLVRCYNLSGQAWAEGTGTLALCRHARFAAGKRTVHTPRHDLAWSHTSTE